jgi:P4 family phage/plasmid primase-like protien
MDNIISPALESKSPPRLPEILELLGPAVLLPITPGTKAPSFKAWEKTTLADMTRPEYLARFGPRHNIGVLQGKASNGLCSVDFDADEWLPPFLTANPKLADTLRTRRSRGCNLWFRVLGEYPALTKLHHPTRKGTEGKPLDVGEWRSTGGQTVIAGEAEGVPYRIEVAAKPVEIAFGEIVWPDFIADPPKIGGNGALPVVTPDAGKLDLGKLKNVVHLDNGSTHAACPACRAAGGDHTGDHLLIDPSGRFGCAKYPSDPKHRREIWKLAGERGADTESELEFARRLAAALPPVKTIGTAFHLYHNGAWQPVNRDTLKPRALAILPEAIRTIRRANTLLEHVEAEHQTAPEAFRGFNLFVGNGDVLLNAGNGLVRVSPGAIELLPHAAEHCFTRQTIANFVPEATAPLFERVLGEVLPDQEDRDLFQLCLGNFLYPDCRHEVALCCYGEAGRGKSTIADPVAAALGLDLVCRLSMSQVCDPRSYHLPKLRFAAVNLGTELTTADIAESGNFKTLVSGEPIEARPIYGVPFVMQTGCKLWFLANSLPRFRHGTEAELRRTRFLRFDYQPPVKDVTLKARLAAEAEGVFLFMVRGLQRLLTCQEIPLGGRESRDVHDRFRVSNDPVGSFVQYRCILATDARAPKDDLRNAFTEFAERHELSTGCGVWFFRALFERFPSLRETQPRVAGERVRYIRGIALRSYSTLTTSE